MRTRSARTSIRCGPCPMPGAPLQPGLRQRPPAEACGQIRCGTAESSARVRPPSYSGGRATRWRRSQRRADCSPTIPRHGFATNWPRRAAQFSSSATCRISIACCVCSCKVTQQQAPSRVFLCMGASRSNGMRNDGRRSGEYRDRDGTSDVIGERDQRDVRIVDREQSNNPNASNELNAFRLTSGT
jgi:hypothetical protein